jgi:hypothetical protein
VISRNLHALTLDQMQWSTGAARSHSLAATEGENETLDWSCVVNPQWPITRP